MEQTAKKLEKVDGELTGLKNVSNQSLFMVSKRKKSSCVVGFCKSLGLSPISSAGLPGQRPSGRGTG